MVTRFLVCLLCFAPSVSVGAAEVAMRIVVQHSPLAGFKYYDGKELWGEIHRGDPLTLVREPNNPHDHNAIRLEWKGHMLGYLPRRENSHLARQLDHGVAVEAHITELTRHRNGRHRLSYEIFVPLQ
jgi:hypothetical protein